MANADPFGGRHRNSSTPFVDFGDAVRGSENPLRMDERPGAIDTSSVADADDGEMHF